MKKISIPFRERRGKDIWPDHKPMAFCVYVALEEYDEAEIVEFNTPPPLTPRILKGLKKADLASMSTVQYGFEVGIYRMMDILDECGVKVSLLVNGLAAEKHPELLRELVGKGCEIIGHGYSQSRFMAQMNVEEQHEVIKKCVAIFQNIAGVRPYGWGSPGTFQYEEIFSLLLREGFTYHIGMHDDEIPYVLEVEGEEMIEIPYRIVPTGELNDFSMYGQMGGARVGQEAITYMKAYFDAKYKEGTIYPQFAALGLHPYVSGRSDRANNLREFLSYVKGHNVWITRFGDVARWWRDHRSF